MQVKLDEHVQAVLEFMQRNVPTDRLVSVAREIDAFAPHLWGHYDADRFAGPVMVLSEQPPAN